MNSGTWTISLSTTSANWNTLSTTFSDNIGADNTQVFSGNLAQPWAFGDTLSIVLTTPFTYNPSLGNLLMTVVATGTSEPGGVIFFDTNGYNDGALNGNTIMGRDYCVEGNCETPTEGNVNSGFGLVTDISNAVVSQQTLTLTEMGEGAGTVRDSNNGTCEVANGSAYAATGDFTVTATGACSASYASGTLVTLTATPSGSSTFGGWGGGACSGTGTCMLTMNSSQSVTADFVAPPITQPLISQYCASGSSNTASATFCPNGIISGGVCQDPNGVVFTAQIPVVTAPVCFSLQVTATEVTGTGICPVGQVPSNGEGFPNGPTTDFDCRFVDFYNYGKDLSGDVYTPLCYPYVNGNCVYYNLQLLDGGGPVPPVQVPAGVYWQINIDPSNAPLTSPFTVPAGYSSAPRLLDDPDYFNSNLPGLPYGTSFVGDLFTGCDDPMLVGSPGVPYTNSSGANIYCQFDNDITTFFSGTVGGDPVGGGKTSSTNDVVLAFERTSSTGPTPAPTPVAPAIVLDCVTGCVSNGGTITFTEGTAGTAAVTETVSPYPTPTLEISMGNTTAVTATESMSNVVTLTTVSGDFGPQFVVPNVYIVVDNCTTTGYNGTFLITGGGSGETTLTYQDAAGSLAPETDGSCRVTALPAGLTFNLATGVLSGTPALSSAGSYPNTTFIASNYNPAISGTGTSAPSYTLVVAPANQATLTVTGPTSLTYGTPEAATYSGGSGTGAVTFSATGGGCSVVSGTVTVTNVSRPCSLTAMKAADSNYNSATSATFTVTLYAAPLTITASNQSKNYGTALALGTTAFTTSTLYNTDTVTGVTLTSAGAAASAAPGTYSIVPSAAVGTGLLNYTIKYMNGTLTVSALEITPLNGLGTVYLGGLGIEGIVLTNKGTVPFMISAFSIGLPGNALTDYRDYPVTLCPPLISALPATIAPGQSCVIGVTIHPTVDIFSPTPSTATLIITDTAAGSPHSLPLTALVIDPLVSLSSTSLSFGNQKTGTTSAAQKVILTNSGLTSLRLTGLKISASFALATGTTCTSRSMLLPGGTCLIYVTFTPTTKGAKYSGSLTITDLTLRGSQTISLSGTGD